MFSFKVAFCFKSGASRGQLEDKKCENVKENCCSFFQIVEDIWMKI